MSKTNRRIMAEKANYRSRLVASSTESWAQYDKMITTLSCGAIGLAMHFISTNKPAAPLCKYGFGAGLFLLSLSLVIALVSHYFSAWASRCAINRLDNDKDVEQVSCLDILVHTLNALSGVSLIFGILVTLLSFYLNIL